MSNIDHKLRQIIKNITTKISIINTNRNLDIILKNKKID